MGMTMSPFYRRASEAQGRGVACLGSQSRRAAIYPVSFRCCPWMRIYAVMGILVLAVPLGVTTEVGRHRGPGASWGRLTVGTVGIVCLPRGSRQALPPHGLASPFTTRASALPLEAEVPDSAAGALVLSLGIHACFCSTVWKTSSSAPERSLSPPLENPLRRPTPLVDAAIRASLRTECIFPRPRHAHLPAHGTLVVLPVDASRLAASQASLDVTSKARSHDPASARSLGTLALGSQGQVVRKPRGPQPPAKPRRVSAPPGRWILQAPLVSPELLLGQQITPGPLQVPTHEPDTPLLFQLTKLWADCLRKNRSY
ncbi:uncharacterized protein LOC115938008 [Leptonychotes weddellii]|uniref:Uncharacterized protein LOC115938008 n=1 Tax=Leptonychotes weddellii TaxID=9713 RepID=A0A7F8Q742_LEPWE|nr:uncharacterized protein LOC115938008 [Leptonychotes weddellii]